MNIKLLLAVSFNLGEIVLRDKIRALEETNASVISERLTTLNQDCGNNLDIGTAAGETCSRLSACVCVGAGISLQPLTGGGRGCGRKRMKGQKRPAEGQ